ncbi:hypothetical protein ABZW18_26075 [Streptomyces sp. NPDC004647]|uniref:hypothetical protein n=1 Tax=Streptomyces sp. NPDC004647 TaxID=3154671 RepID=UPI0033B2BFA6
MPEQQPPRAVHLVKVAEQPDVPQNADDTMIAEWHRRVAEQLGVDPSEIEDAVMAVSTDMMPSGPITTHVLTDEPLTDAEAIALLTAHDHNPQARKL